MINNFKTTTRKDDIRLITWIVAIFLFVTWLCTPPGNKFLQVCFWGNNTKLFISKIFHDSNSTEYLFHRNNAVYLAKMYKDKKTALKEMDRAIQTLPTYAQESELQSLYRDRAIIRMSACDYSGALSDFMNSGDISFTDNLKVALLYKLAGNYKEAMSYCNRIIELDSTAYSGYACIADLYTSLGKHNSALKVWNLAIDRRKNNARAYVDRAKVKKLLGDLEGYEEDIKIAKEYLPSIDIEESLIEETLHPRILTLTIK